MIDWSLLSTPNIAGALNAGVQAGREQKRQYVTDGALSALATDPANQQALGALRMVAPDMAWKFEDRVRDTAKRSALADVFTPPEPSVAGALSTASGVTPQPNALSGAVPSSAAGGPVAGVLSQYAQPSLPGGAGAVVPSDPSLMSTSGAANVAAPPSAAPSTLVDPARLAPRTDGLAINHAALRELYRSDPETAFQVQKMVYDADAASFKRIQQHGATMAQAALHLQTINDADGNEDIAGRTREVEVMAPQLAELGLTPDMLANADLTNRGLDRYLAMGRSLNDLTRDHRADQRLEADLADDEADNERADRNTNSVIADRGARRGLVARGQNMTDARGRRGQDVASTDRRRGQDMSDKRLRETGGGKRLPTVSSPDEARKLPSGTKFRTPGGKIKVVP